MPARFCGNFPKPGLFLGALTQSDDSTGFGHASAGVPVQWKKTPARLKTDFFDRVCPLPPQTQCCARPLPPKHNIGVCSTPALARKGVFFPRIRRPPEVQKKRVQGKGWEPTLYLGERGEAKQASGRSFRRVFFSIAPEWNQSFFFTTFLRRLCPFRVKRLCLYRRCCVKYTRTGSLGKVGIS